jgi:outer membrane lipoprotein LolB
MRALASLALAAILLGGCATLRRAEAPDPAAWAARRAALAPVSDYRLEGRISIAAGREGVSGSLDWTQRGAALDARFAGPFGLGGLRIWGDAENLELRTRKGEQVSIVDPERDLEARLGWSIPIRAMRYWLLGVPAPDTSFVAEVDGRGRARVLEQADWRVSYDEYQRAASHELPRRFVIERVGVRIKVLVDRWHFALPVEPAVDAVP